MRFVIDIDGTICRGGDFKIENAKPIPKRISYLNMLYDNGDTIVYFTARGMGRFEQDAQAARDAFYQTTKDQLDSWGAKYHELILGKPSADIYIDDKGINARDFFKA